MAFGSQDVPAKHIVRLAFLAGANAAAQKVRELRHEPQPENGMDEHAAQFRRIVLVDAARQIRPDDFVYAE